MSDELLTQIRAYYEGIDAGQEPIGVDEVAARVPTADLFGGDERSDLDARRARRRVWRRGRAVAAVAAVVAALVVAVMLLLNVGGDPQSVEVTPADTSEPEATIDSVPATDPPAGTELSAPTGSAEPTTQTGDGPRLEFAPVPLDDQISAVFDGGSSVWFDDALYVIGSAPDAEGVEVESIARTSDGFDWEVVADLDSLASSEAARLVGSDELLVAVGDPAPEPGLTYGSPYGSEEWPAGRRCGTSAVTDVAASVDGENWTVSQLDTSVFDPLFDLGGCVGVTVGEATVGAGQALVVNRYEARFDEHTYSGRLLAELRPDLDFTMVSRVAEESTPGEAALDVDGQRVVIPFDDAAFAAAKQRYDEFVATELDAAGGRAFVWTSPDGADWSSVEPTGPLAAGDVALLTGASDGFYLRTDSVTIEYTPDLVNWEVLLSLDDLPLERWGELGITRWGDDIVMQPSGRLLRTDEPIYPDGATYVDGDFGEFGMFGIGCPSDDAACEEQRAEFFYSDGASWARWTPTELDSLGEIEFPTVVGIGDDFVVLNVNVAADPAAPDEDPASEAQPRIYVASLP